MATHQQLQLLSPGSKLALISKPTPSPGSDEVSVRVKAVALNPIDWKSRQYGITIASYPAGMGFDSAGVVEAIGSDVTSVKVGDEVMVTSLDGKNLRNAAFQEVAVIGEYAVAKKPKSLSFEEAAAWSCCYVTAAAAVAKGLRLPLPIASSPPVPPSSPSVKSVLLLGGASLVGFLSLQVLRLVLPQSTKIFTTSSPKHFSKLKALGADQTFDRSLSTEALAEGVRKASPEGIDAVLDAVSAIPGMEGNFWELLDPRGPKLFSGVITGPEPTKFPSDVKGEMISANIVFEMLGTRRAELMHDLTDLIESGKIKLGADVRVVGKGLESINAALDALMEKGVSGEKLVVTL